MQDEERDFIVRERKEKSKLQKEIEVMQRQLIEMESVKKQDLQTAQSEFERIQRDYRIVQEEKRMANAKLQEIQSEFEIIRRQYEQKKDD